MIRRSVLLFTALALVYAFAGCGGGGGSPSGPAAAAPVDSSVFVEATLRPRGSVKSKVEALAKNVAGIKDLGEKIVAELEKSARAEGEPFDYAKEVEPWLGEEGGIFLTGYDGDDFSGHGFILQTSDPGASEEFIDRQAESSKEPVSDGSYEGIKYKSDADGTTIGVVGDFFLIAGDLKSFEAAVDASDGESLADSDRYSEAIAQVPDGSLASVYVDIGLLIEEAGPVDPQAKLFLQAVGIDPADATATASAIPGSDRFEVDVSTDVTREYPIVGDASALLGALPVEAVAAVVSPEFGKALGSAIDAIDANGIPGQVPPHRFKQTLKKAGIDLDRIATSIDDLGVFVVGSRESDVAGAVVLSAADANQAKNTVSNLGLLLRASHVPGVTAISGKASGFSIRSDALGPKPVVVATSGKLIAIGYSRRTTLLALAEDRPSLSDSTSYQEAVASLGKTPISGFVYGPGTLELIESFVPADDAAFQKAEPYLTEIFFVAIGSEVSGGHTITRLIVDFGG